jgi:hypothetical protein
VISFVHLGTPQTGHRPLAATSLGDEQANTMPDEPSAAGIWFVSDAPLPAPYSLGRRNALRLTQRVAKFVAVPVLDASSLRGKSSAAGQSARGGIRMHWETPTFVEIDMSAEIGSYQDDFDGI